MNYLSVCSGIEAATVAWHPLGWRPVAFAQYDPEHDYKCRPDFASRVLAYHYPSTPNLGDMTKFRDWPDADVNILVGGTPCQSFSVAGLRKGMADPRGNLALIYLAIADRYRPKWLLWENVPGVLSSSGGRDFGAFIGGLAELGYHAAWRVLDAQYVRVDGFTLAVPQRRRRVFVIGYLGDWRRAAAVLFERESMSWNNPPRREAGKKTSPTISSRSADGGGLGTDFDCDGGLIAKPLRGQPQHSHRADSDNMIAVAHTLRGEGFDASEDGGGKGTPLIPIPFDTTQITSKTCRSNPQPGEMINPVITGWAVRRLTPRECERLQGFPDDYTNIAGAVDGSRYKALGNSMAVNVMRWLGRRIQMVAEFQ